MRWVFVCFMVFCFVFCMSDGAGKATGLEVQEGPGYRGHPSSADPSRWGELTAGPFQFLRVGDGT